MHAHILPGIDDGPAELEESLAMARAAAHCGIATIASTPHLRADFPRVQVDELADRCRALRQAIERERIPIGLVSGAEVSLNWAAEADDDQLVLASYGHRGADLLIETPLTWLVVCEWIVDKLQALGYRITLGHPERSRDFQRDDTTLRALVERGVLLQIDADSLLRATGNTRNRRFARRLLTEGLAHAIASDGHRARSWRPVTQLAAAVAAATELVGAERAGWMAEAAPSAIVNGAELPPAPPITKQRRRQRLFGG
jgi:protein-tyrosine phosphatase